MKLIKSFCMSRQHWGFNDTPTENRKFCSRHVSCMFVFGKRIIQNKNKIIFGLAVFGLIYICVFTV